MTSTSDLEQLIRSIVETFDREGIPYAIVGAYARNAWARPRATTDADFAVELDAGRLARLLAAADALDLTVRKTRTEVPEDPVPDLLLLVSRRDPALRVDFLVAKTQFERSAVARAQATTLAGVPCRVADPDDLVVYKIVAGRTQDFADVEEVVRARRAAGRPIDWTHVERWAADFGLEQRVADLRQRLGE